MSHQGCGAVKAAYLKNQAFSPSLTELVSDIKSGLKQNNINTDDSSSYAQACIQHSQITARSLIESSQIIKDAVLRKKLLVQPAFLHIDPLSIEWLDNFYGIDWISVGCLELNGLA